MQRLLRFGVLATVTALSIIGSGAIASARTSHGDTVGHVYVNNNTAGINSISGFDRHADGTLTAIPGSPFDIGGAGIGAPTGSQGSLQLSADGKYLLAVDAGSNEISVARIEHDGAIRLVHSSPVSSGGMKPVSIAVSGGLVYVANAGVGGSNYTGFTLNGGGRLEPIAGSTFALPDIANPGDILFNGNGSYLVGVRVGPNAGPSYIDTFIVGSDGRLTPAAGSPFASQVTGPFGSVFSPNDPSQLFVTNAHGGAGAGSVSVFDLANGVPTAIANSPFANGQSGTCWAEITASGDFLFAVNTGSSTISRYSIASDGTLSLLGSTPITNPGTGGLGAFDARLTPDGNYMYVVDSSGRISGFAVTGGNLTELESSPVSLAPGVTPFGIVTT
jgi:hypothetical protein